MRRMLAALAVPALLVIGAAGPGSVGAIASMGTSTAAAPEQVAAVDLAPLNALPHLAGAPTLNGVPLHGGGGRGGCSGGALDSLVTDGTITSAQKDAITTALQTAFAAEHAARHGEILAQVLDPIVKDGTITSAQVDTIAKALEAARQAARDSGTRPERGQLLEDVLDKLVADKSLTQAQADAVTKQMESVKGTFRHGGQRPDAAAHDELLTTALDPLVKNGTITQAQADAVKNALEAARPAPKLNETAPSQPNSSEAPAAES